MSPSGGTVCARPSSGDDTSPFCGAVCNRDKRCSTISRRGEVFASLLSRVDRRSCGTGTEDARSADRDWTLTPFPDFDAESLDPFEFLLESLDSVSIERGASAASSSSSSIIFFFRRTTRPRRTYRVRTLARNCSSSGKASTSSGASEDCAALDEAARTASRSGEQDGSIAASWIICGTVCRRKR